MTQNPTPNPTHSHTVAENALVRRVVAADADSAATVGAVGPLLVGVATVVEVVAHAVAVTAVATDERAQRPVEALRQQAALGVQYAARTLRPKLPLPISKYYSDSETSI